MGATNSKVEEDKALQLCRERRKFVRQALDGRCSLAAAHVMYIQALRNTGTALGKFVEPDAHVESSLYASTSATPEPLPLMEKSLSHFSFSSASFSHRVDAAYTLSPSPSPPPTSTIYHANQMKFTGSYSREVQEKLISPTTGTMTFSSTPRNATPDSTEKPQASAFEDSPIPPGAPQWDFFGLFHPIDHQFSSQEGKRMNQGFEDADDIKRLREEEGIPELEDDDEKGSIDRTEEFQDSDDEFDEPSTETLVRRFENVNRINDESMSSPPPTLPSVRSATSEGEFVNGDKGECPDVSSQRGKSAAVAPSSETKRTPVKDNCDEQKVTAKDFSSSIKDIGCLFIKASESGREVPRKLEANELHFRPMFPGKERAPVISVYLRACFSCGEGRRQVQEEPVQAAMKYLTWHRTGSSRSSSSRNPSGLNLKDDTEELNGNYIGSFCMISGSHASTLDRLYAWERKLYDEVKACDEIRRDYDVKCKLLRQLESKGHLDSKERTERIGKTRASIKDLHSRVIVAIHRIDSISKRLEELRDKELQPQLEELIEGLGRMWEVMFECHKLQFNIISVAYSSSNTKIPVYSEGHRQITLHLENELSSLSSSFTKWIGAQKTYLEAINNWLGKCILLPQKPPERKRWKPRRPLWSCGPPIYATCELWLQKLEALPSKDVAESVKGLAAEIHQFLPRQERNQGKNAKHPRTPPTPWEGGNGADLEVNTLRDYASEDWTTGVDRFRSSLVGFLGKLNKYAESSVDMYTSLEKAIQESKSNYDKLKSQA
ncbi:protein ALTERED PHOSPHATE STARVATION RESPONSE 1-like [Rhodamnia argentea]|uniref:Protein ALTERED PHOSPHATE STARVATION RESPONSE 1-like n=1 Tax=Rhodamnia argentea TaxID=178133 RepID=A0ABM3HHF3_9MYRT|nr:protein ALTERED PHOSPHATE STARVATION RESPONSE 1-like [Rhodamnia argentea]XP_048136031.1 protein ALTERED PHOSPHATE STARVATION RESPONSE 1-like [Rhodamnia argentea]